MIISKELHVIARQVHVGYVQVTDVDNLWIDT